MGGRASGGANAGMGRGSQMSVSQRIANASIPLKSSDLSFKERWDEEANESFGENLFKRWDTDVQDIAYKDNGNVVKTGGTITQYLDKPGSRKIGGYEVYFDKAYAVATASTLEGAKEKLVNYINSKRK